MEKEKNSFLITCVSCIIILLLMCYFGINTTSKATMAYEFDCNANEVQVHSESEDVWCCPKTAEITSGAGYKLAGFSSTSSSMSAYCINKNYEVKGAGSGNQYCEITVDGNESCPSGWTSSEEYANSNGGTYFVCTASLDVCGEEGRLANQITESEEFEISYYVNGERTDVVPVYKNEVYTIEDPRQSVIPSNCSFITWYALTANNDRKEYNPGDEYTVTGNLELHADYNCMVDVVANAGNGTITKVDGVNNLTPNLKDYPQSCIIGYNRSKCSIGGNVEASLDGYTFNGWGEQGCTSGKPITQYEVSQNTTFYACYTKNETTTPTTKTFNATFKDYNGSELSRTSCTTTGTNTYCQVSAPTTKPTRDGYTFNGWSWGGNDCSRIWHSTMTISGDLSFYACYTKNSTSVDPEQEKPETNNQKPETNVDENPQTGSIAIFIVWVIGIAAIVYSVWYFRKNNV